MVCLLLGSDSCRGEYSTSLFDSSKKEFLAFIAGYQKRVHKAISRQMKRILTTFWFLLFWG